mmetsp:Transcript_40463/g.73154  ORF Transcript_40463/g.73154 Transcript_40463/m.73154 type:complete len:401 (-) Transcript_40463:373-1575(-)
MADEACSSTQAFASKKSGLAKLGQLPTIVEEDLPCTAVAVGQTGVGKSTFLNLLFADMTKFATSTKKLKSVTQKAQVEELSYNGKRYRFIDTVGSSDTTRDVTEAQVQTDVYNLMDPAGGRIDVVFIVVKYDRLIAEKDAAFRWVDTLLGDGAVKFFAVLVLTHTGNKTREELMKEYLEQDKTHAQRVMQLVPSNRWILVQATTQKDGQNPRSFGATFLPSFLQPAREQWNAFLDSMDLYSTMTSVREEVFQVIESMRAANDQGYMNPHVFRAIEDIRRMQRQHAELEAERQQMVTLTRTGQQRVVDMEQELEEGRKAQQKLEQQMADMEQKHQAQIKALTKRMNDREQFWIAAGKSAKFATTLVVKGAKGAGSLAKGAGGIAWEAAKQGVSVVRSVYDG